MDLTRTPPRLPPTGVESGLSSRDNGLSVADLTTRLAQEGIELAALQLRRLGVEVRERRRHAVRASVAVFLGAATAGIGIMTLAGGAVLYFGRMWGDHATAALATGGLLLLFAAAAGAVFASAMRGIAGTPADEAQEGSPRNGT